MADENTGKIAKQFDSLLDALGDLDGTGNKITIQTDSLPNNLIPRELVDQVTNSANHRTELFARPERGPYIEPPVIKFMCTPANKGSLVLYKVNIPFTNICIMDNIYDLRAANFICDSLNSGAALTDKKLLGVICICMEMNTIITDIERAVTERHMVIKECKYDKAQIFDEQLKALYQKTDAVKAKLNKYMG